MGHLGSNKSLFFERVTELLKVNAPIVLATANPAANTSLTQ
jgi:hypothetical protein